MRGYFDRRQLAHAPERELHNGGYMAYAESPARAEAVAAALPELEAPEDRGEGPILAVHDAGYVDFLKRVPRLWADAGREGDATGYVWPVVGRRPLNLSRVDALIGQHSFDASTPVTADSWSSAYWASQSALAATDAVLNGERAAFALCRPPGHHAGADYCGGYCYLNHAAVAAQAARDAGKARVAILDIDYHHGNGTQDIFADRADVFYASIHADPTTDYPFFWGHADERGHSAGEGATLNLPLPRGTTLAPYRAALQQALDAVAAFSPELLVVSLGVDTYAGDAISFFGIETADYAVLARDIAARGWPTAILMEGGYTIDAIGANVSRFLSGF
ncbi:histone deacetylase family protein [Stakelama tenebrarum]|uniref:Histone deacetylase family protein n=1 Tax=Stakelama tenebrarum TaxID=2711215 RepID=A0A6G6Y0Q6_9SPHN|nr:histone deacetylase family protein [Sphingosinithalassobacter tenebrarum]QIG78505.1 histone deacetylase family protein [Sphingosinithalassobacter tenebrarum]